MADSSASRTRRNNSSIKERPIGGLVWFDSRRSDMGARVKRKIKQHRRRCWKCNKLCANAGSRARHLKAMHYVAPPPPPPKPEKHVLFASLVKKGTNWGRKKPDGVWGDPTDNELIMGYLGRIADTLDDILQELRRTKTIA